MNSSIRNRCLVLVLMIFISQTALLAHTIYHTDKDTFKCELCVCQAQQAHGLPFYTFFITQVSGCFIKTDTTQLLSPDQFQVRPWYQRAPPVIA